MANPASALGEAIGHLFEQGVRDCLTRAVEARQHTIKPSRMRNGTQNQYQIDAVIHDQQDMPVVLIDPKYLRYTKHNRDKVSWLCAAHYNLRKTYPTIRKSIAVLAGRWSESSKSLARSFGIDVLEVHFESMVDILMRYGIQFDWPENNQGSIAEDSLAVLKGLPPTTKDKIAYDLASTTADELNRLVIDVLDADIENVPSRISGVELLLKTNKKEVLLVTFDSAVESLQYMAGLVKDVTDVSELLLRDSMKND